MTVMGDMWNEVVLTQCLLHLLLKVQSNVAVGTPDYISPEILRVRQVFLAVASYYI